MTTTDDDLERRLRATLREIGAAAQPPEGLAEQLYRGATTAAARPAEAGTSRVDVTTARQAEHPRRRALGARWAPLVAAALVAMVAMVAVVAGVVAAHRSATTLPLPTASTGDPVPWSGAGGRSTTVTAPPMPIARATPETRGCVSDDFRLLSGSTQPAPGSRGWMVTTYTVLSVASSACADRKFSAVLVDAQGTPLPIDRTSSGGVRASRTLLWWIREIW